MKNERPVVIVTGSATGVGRATVLRFARMGFDVVVNYSRSQAEARRNHLSGHRHVDDDRTTVDHRRWTERLSVALTEHRPNNNCLVFLLIITRSDDGYFEDATVIVWLLRIL